jgi:hypothetical protein
MDDGKFEPRPDSGNSQRHQGEERPKVR